MEVVSAAHGVLGPLVGKLTSLLADECVRLKGVRREIRSLRSELISMQAAVQKYSKLQNPDVQVKAWISLVRELAYDTEDVIDKFVHHLGNGSYHGGFKEFFRKTARRLKTLGSRHGIANQIDDLKARVKEVKDLKSSYRLDDVACSAFEHPAVDPRLSALFVEEEHLVGIDGPRDDLVSWMMKEENCSTKHRKVLSIVGFGGLGKTTLAREVYRKIQGHFQCWAFVSISQKPNVKKIMKDVISQVPCREDFTKDIDTWDEKQFIAKLRELLQNKRYLIVIDDIWAEEPWDEVIKPALIENNMRRIITTTRNADVARYIGGYYRLKPLSVESSEILFYGRIFGREVKCPSHFYEVSKRILKKCGGIPLAITTISSLLANKPHNIKEWNNVFDSIGSGLLGSDPAVDSLKKILLLSYDDLPSHLRTCLLYLSIFPEDYKIGKDGLIWRWVAEGFVQEKKGDQSFYDIGKSYFNELLNRSMIQPADMDEEGTPYACRVHDTVLDLIVSLSVEESFVTIVSGDGNHSLGSNQAIRRLSLHNCTSWPIMKNMQKLRSISILEPAGIVTGSMPSLSSFELLRVLDLQGRKLEDIESMRFIGSLSHLRYLRLSSRIRPGYAADQLPVEIGKLRFLQTLDVSQANVQGLPSSIVRLNQLMCLRGSSRNSTPTLLPVGLKNLTSLEVLNPTRVTSVCVAEELGHLTQLRVLVIMVRRPANKDDIVDQARDDLRPCTKALVESLGKLKKIEYLHILHYVDYYMLNLDGSMEGPLDNLRWLRIVFTCSLPTWIKPSLLPGLSYLRIDVFQERKDDIHVLGTLPCLRHLRFIVWRAPEQLGALDRCVVGDDAFPCAVSCEFDIWGGPNLLPCMFPPGAMQRLQDLKFRVRIRRGGGYRCTIDDLGLGHLPSLRSVTVFESYYKDFEVREKLKHEAAVHPNHPTIHFRAY